MKSIETLVEDIHATLANPKAFPKRVVNAFGKALAQRISDRLTEERGAGTLRASNLGKPCSRQLWYDVHAPSDREPLEPSARIKFLYGDILEELLRFLARQAGHSVVADQTEVSLHGVKGHLDGIVDGRLVDFKSASTYSFKKFEEHKLNEDDPFGYVTQLDTYLHASQDNPELLEKDVASFVAIDKTLGHIVVDTYPKTDTDYKALVAERREMLEKKEPPERPFEAVAHQKGGNEKIPTICSYCPFKEKCWADANDGKGLRKFFYSGKPVFLTTVKKEPKVDEGKPRRVENF